MDLGTRLKKKKKSKDGECTCYFLYFLLLSYLSFYMNDTYINAKIIVIGLLGTISVKIYITPATLLTVIVPPTLYLTPRLIQYTVEKNEHTPP